MSGNLLVLPILIPFGCAIASVLARRRLALQRALSVVGAVALLAIGGLLLARTHEVGMLVLQVGNWPAPFGITLAADRLSAIMILLTGILAVTVAPYALASLDAGRQRFGYFPLFHVLLMGVCGAFLTGDLFNLYVWFEVMLIASFVLLVLGGERAQLEGGVKYVTLNLVSSAVFLAGAGIIYGTVGTLNFADLARQLVHLPHPGTRLTLAALLLVAFGIKAAVFPLYFWLPASYHTPPVAVTALFAGLLTKVGVYALVRIFTLLFPLEGIIQSALLAVAGLTMLAGVLGALAQRDMRRLLAFNIVSEIGFLLMGLALASPLALAGAVFFLFNVTLAKSALFLAGGIVERLRGSADLARLGGIYRDHPWVALLVLIPALTVAGIPPLSGFWAKLMLIQAGLASSQWLLTATALLVSLLTLLTMVRIWAALWAAPPDGVPAAPLARPQAALLGAPVVALIVLAVVLGLGAEPAVVVARAAAAQLLDPHSYIEAVLGTP